MKYVIVLVLGLMLVFTGCSKERLNTGIPEEQKKLLLNIPSEAQFVMYMNIAELKESVYWFDYLSPTINDYKENFWISGFNEVTGKPIENYLSDFLLASLDTERSIKVYRFSSGRDKVKLYLENDKYFKRDADGYFESVVKPGSFFILSQPDVLVTFNWKKGLIDFTGERYNPLEENGKFTEIIGQITNKKKYWMATDRGSFASAMMRKIFPSNGYKQVTKVLSKVNSISFAADFADKIDIESVWGCNDPASSGLIAAAARSAIAMDLFSDKEYALGKIMDKVSVETDASDVVFKINLNKNDIKDLKTIAEKRNLDKKL